MPIPILAQVLQDGISTVPYAWTIIRTVPWLLLLAALKYYFGGARNTSERLMHSKVVMVTVCTNLHSTFKPESSRNLCNYILVRAEHPVLELQLSTSSPLAAPKSSSSLNNHRLTSSLLNTLTICDVRRATSSFTPSKSTSPPSTRSVPSPRNGLTTPHLAALTL